MKEYFRGGARWTTAPKPQMSDELYDQVNMNGKETANTDQQVWRKWAIQETPSLKGNFSKENREMHNNLEIHMGEGCSLAGKFAFFQTYLPGWHHPSLIQLKAVF